MYWASPLFSLGLGLGGSQLTTRLLKMHSGWHLVDGSFHSGAGLDCRSGCHRLWGGAGTLVQLACSSMCLIEGHLTAYLHTFLKSYAFKLRFWPGWIHNTNVTHYIFFNPNKQQRKHFLSLLAVWCHHIRYFISLLYTQTQDTHTHKQVSPYQQLSMKPKSVSQSGQVLSLSISPSLYLSLSLFLHLSLSLWV